MKKCRITILLLMCLAAALLMSGCGVSHKSPEGVVKSLVKYAEKGSAGKMEECYGMGKEADKATSAQIESMIKYFKAMKSEGITLVECDVIQDYKSYVYVYISYTVDLAKDKSYPKLDTYLVNKKDNKNYVIPAKDITTEMSKAAETAYTTFMTTDPYKEYKKSYDAFILKSPNFEEEISLKLN